MQLGYPGRVAKLVVPCPACGTVSTAAITGARVSLAPTGGDYDWVQTDGKASCPACGHPTPVRVEIDIDSGRITSLVSSPKPSAPNVVWWVVAAVSRHGASQSSVRAFSVHPSQAAARKVAGERAVLKLDHAGYHDADGQVINDLFTDVIRYE